MLCSISSVLFVLITFSLQNPAVASPVVLWSSENLPSSPVSLSTLSSLDLISDSICKLSNEQIQLHIIAVNDLSIEDIHQSLQRENPLLSEIKNEKTQFRFYPNVDDAVYHTFSLLPQSNNMKCSHTHFQLASLQTAETLHDATHDMQKTISGVQTDGKQATVVALISHPTAEGKLSRQRRLVAATSKTNIVVSDNKTCMFYAKNLTWNDVAGTKTAGRGYDLDMSATKCEQHMNATNGNHTWVTLDVVWVNPKASNDTVNMRLIATIIGRYWYLTSATLNNSEYRYFAYGMHSRMDTPPAYSYACPTATFTRYDAGGKYGAYNVSNKFYIKHFQFQPFHGNGLAFGPPNYCTSFFTSGIWMGITSSLLCLAILLFGIHRIMSIKSNDRFDDPKGKPLVIKAQE